jgi:hypothetical protein
LLILATAFVVAFCTTVFLLLMFPHAQDHEIRRSQLAAENQVMRKENKELLLGIRKLDSDVSRVEGLSQKVVATTNEK